MLLKFSLAVAAVVSLVLGAVSFAGIKFYTLQTEDYKSGTYLKLATATMVLLLEVILIFAIFLL